MFRLSSAVALNLTDQCTSITVDEIHEIFEKITSVEPVTHLRRVESSQSDIQECPVITLKIIRCKNHICVHKLPQRRKDRHSSVHILHMLQQAESFVSPHTMSMHHHRKALRNTWNVLALLSAIIISNYFYEANQWKCLQGIMIRWQFI